MSLNSSKQPAPAAKVTMSHQSTVARIANEIVDLVEQTDGPVLLTEIQENVAGFKAPPGPNWTYFIRHDAGETVIWNGMTRSGYNALRRVLNGRRVALQYVSALPYLLEGLIVTEPNWQPVVLLPVRGANIDGPVWAERASPAARQLLLGPAGAGRFYPLVAQPIRFTADAFAIN
jgi:hypothetical protein